MPSLKDAYSRGENNQSKQNSTKELNKDFARMFTEACNKDEQNTIHVSINSYTKNATPFSTFIAMKDYTHQMKQVVMA